MKTLNSIFLTLLSAFAGLANAAEQAGPGRMGDNGMMDGGMMNGGMMMGGPAMFVCALFGLLILIVLILAIPALIKYLRSDKS